MVRRLILAAIAIATTAVAAQAQTWVRLGAREVDVTKPGDTIDVTAAKGSYQAIRLQTPNGDIKLNNVEVRYTGTNSHNERRTINLLQGERTRPINPGGEKFVDQVVLSIDADKGARRLTVVEVWGLQSAAGAKAVRPAATGAKPPATTIPAAPTPPVPSAATPGQALPGGEVLFGAQRVGFGVDRDVIRVGSEIGQFDRIRLRVLENDIYINDLTVIYADGQKDTLAVNSEVKQNTRTRWLSLKGDRFIKEIQMTYRSRPNFKGQARIEVFGEYSEGWLGPQGRGRQFNQGWVLLGAQTAGFIGFDNDLIPVGRNEGGFKQVRVTVRDRAITLNELRIVYGNNEEDIIPVKQKVDAGSTYGPVDLKGGTRVIKEVRAKYRSRFLDKDAVGKGAAIVEVWGKH